VTELVRGLKMIPGRARGDKIALISDDLRRVVSRLMRRERD
jgi:hypothetical protein